MGIIRRLVGVQNLEVSAEPSEGLDAWLRRGGGQSWAGVDVSPNTANAVSSWFASHRNIAEDIGKLPFILYRQGEQRERATESPYWRLVHDRVSTRWTSQQFREYMTFHASEDGDAFALKMLNGPQVRELIPFRRGEVTSELDDSGDFIYHVPLNGRTETLTRRHIFHLEGFAMRTDGGAKLFSMSREDIGLSLAMERHGAKFFGNGAAPGGALKHKQTLSTAAYDRLRDSMREDFGGSNAYSPLLLEEDMDWVQFSVDNEKSQFLDARKFQVTEHSRRVRIPPHKISDLERATFSNIEHSAIEYVQDSLLPWALRWENAYNMQVIDGRALYAELLFDMLLRGDSTTRSQVYNQALTSGWMTQNDVRRRENLPPIDGGDVLYTPLNLATPRDRELAQLKLQTDALGTLVRAGYDPDESAERCGFAGLSHTGTFPTTRDPEREVARV